MADVLSNTYTSPEVIIGKKHFSYLKDYLGIGGLNAKTIIVEEEYISKDFLHDYASYYALCFEAYPKRCKRIHFFGHEFTEEEAIVAIVQESSRSQEFWSHYLGFVVVKPIPVTVIGFTVLKTYQDEPGDRKFWGLRDYTVHLYGNEIQLKSLAFQEQDSVLAACATTAIWSMLNKAAIDFHTVLKSPSQITQDADTVSPDGSRLFPNRGLSLLQICQAISNSGLVSEIKQPDVVVKNNEGKDIGVVSVHYLKKILNAYSPVGIPIILIVEVPSGDIYGLHAIAVCGYKQSLPQHITPREEISWVADNIEKIYAHDDQWGPYSRIELLEEAGLQTPWTVFDGRNRTTFVTNIVVPIYPKIRISYEDIEAIVLGLDLILSLFFDGKVIADLVWDIKVDYTDNFKKNIRASSLRETEKLKCLTQSLPKYLWVSSLFIGEDRILDFTFDATNVNNGMIGKNVILYLPEIREVLLTFLQVNEEIVKPLFPHKSSGNYYQFLLEQLG